MSKARRRGEKEPTRTMVRATMVVMVWPVLGWVMTDPTSRPMDCAVSKLSRTAAQLAKKEPASYLHTHSYISKNGWGGCRSTSHRVGVVAGQHHVGRSNIIASTNMTAKRF